MKYYNENDERLAKLLNLGSSFDVIRREVGKEVKVILYFLSSLADGERVNELNRVKKNLRLNNTLIFATLISKPHSDFQN